MSSHIQRSSCGERGLCQTLLLLIARAVPTVCFNNSATGVATDAMTWSGAYAFDSQPAPLTLSFKALEHRHMVHVLQRDGRDRTRAVQTSWFNGAGIHSWENVFGIWNGLTPRVAAATAAVATLLRGLGPLVQGRKTRSLFLDLIACTIILKRATWF